MKKLIYSQEDLDLILSLELDKYKNVVDKIKEYVKENSIYYNTSDGCQWVDQFKVLDKIDKLLEEVE